MNLFNDLKTSEKYNYNKIEDGYLIEKEGKIIFYKENIKGANQAANYFWLVILFLFGFSFAFAGIASYFRNSPDFSKFTFLGNFSSIEFIPQGILLLFYGMCAILLAFLIYFFIFWEIGSGTNVYDIESEVVRITRQGFPTFAQNLSLKQRNLYLVYPFSEIFNLELNFTDGLNPKRIIYLGLKDGRRIPLTPSNQLNDLIFLEGRAIFLAKLLKKDLKLNNN
jgi:hypothetical protein